MSVVNFAEVVSHLRRLGVPEFQTELLAEQMGFEVLDADKFRGVKPVRFTARCLAPASR